MKRQLKADTSQERYKYDELSILRWHLILKAADVPSRIAHQPGVPLQRHTEVNEPETVFIHGLSPVCSGEDHSTCREINPFHDPVVRPRSHRRGLLPKVLTREIHLHNVGGVLMVEADNLKQALVLRTLGASLNSD